MNISKILGFGGDKKGVNMKHDKETITYTELKEMGVCEEALHWLKESDTNEFNNNSTRRHNLVDKKNCMRIDDCNNCPMFIKDIYLLVSREHPECVNWMLEHFTVKALGLEPKTEQPKDQPGPKFAVGDCVKMGFSDELNIVTEIELANKCGIIHYVLDYPKDGKFQYQLSPESNLTLVYPAKVVEAIKGSWRKWNNIWLGKQKDGGIKDCPLCKIFYKEIDNCPTCAGCPIANKTGAFVCRKTPYKRTHTSTEALAFRDWIAELLPKSVVDELLKETESQIPNLLYKVGDRVIIRDDLNWGMAHVASDMVQYKGKAATITKVSDNPSEPYRIDLDDKFFYWTDAMFSGLAEKKWCCSSFRDNFWGNFINTHSFEETGRKGISYLESVNSYAIGNKESSFCITFCPFCGTKLTPPIEEKKEEETFKVGDKVLVNDEKCIIHYSGSYGHEVGVVIIDGDHKGCRKSVGNKFWLATKDTEKITLSELRALVGDRNATFERIS